MTQPPRKLLLYVLLSLALLTAQVGALAHSYSHVRAAGDPAGLAGASGSLCGQCLSFAPLLATAHASHDPVVCHLVDVGLSPIIEPVARFAPARIHAFQSRAPPLLV